MSAPWQAGAAVMKTACRAAEVRGMWRSVLRYTKQVCAPRSAQPGSASGAPACGCAHLHAGRACCLKPPRAAAQMPKAQQDYYYSYARQNFVSFSDEDDPERIHFLIEVCVRVNAYMLRPLPADVCVCVRA